MTASTRPAARRARPTSRLVAALCVALAARPAAPRPARSPPPVTARWRSCGAVLHPVHSADNATAPRWGTGPAGQHWLLSTAKSTRVCWCTTPRAVPLLRASAGPGAGAGRFARPNGITVIDDVLLVVERDNHRVQALRLPDFAPLGTFGDTLLRLPYGVGWYEEAPGRYAVYVTDNYEAPDGTTPPDRELGARVKQFRVTFDARACAPSTSGASATPPARACCGRSSRSRPTRPTTGC
jgi:3-phytase